MAGGCDCCTDAPGKGAVWSAGLHLSVPVLGGGRTRGRVAQARSDVAVIEIDRSPLRAAAALEVRLAVDAIREARQTVGALAGTVAQAERVPFMAERRATSSA